MNENILYDLIKSNREIWDLLQKKNALGYLFWKNDESEKYILSEKLNSLIDSYQELRTLLPGFPENYENINRLFEIHSLHHSCLIESCEARTYHFEGEAIHFMVLFGMEHGQLLSILGKNYPKGSISIIDKDLKILYTGGSGFDKYNLNAKDYIGKNLQEVFDPELYNATMRILPDVIAGEAKTISVEFQQKTFENTYSPVKYDEQVKYIILTSHELTDRAQLGREIEQLTKFMDCSSDAIQVSDVNGKLIYINKKASERLKIEKEDCGKYHVWDFEPLFKNQSEWEAHVQYLKESKENAVIESVNYSKDKKTKVYVEVTVRYEEIDGKGFIIANSRDISERKKAEKEIRRKQVELDMFFGNSIYGAFFMMLDQPIEWNEKSDKEALIEYAFEHQRVTRYNQAILDQYGYRAEEYEGFTPADFFVHNPEEGKALWRILFDTGKISGQTVEKKKDGTQVIFEGDYVVLYDEEGRITGHFGIQQDITERVKTQEELQKSKEFLEQINQSTRIGNWEINLLNGEIFWSDVTREIFEVEPNKKNAEGFEPLLEERINFYKEGYSRDRIAEVVDKAIKEGIPFNEDLEIVTAKGNERWVRVIGDCEFEAGKPIRVFGSLYDIDESKRLEIALAKSNEIVKQASKVAKFGAWEMDMESLLMTWTDGLYEIYQLPEADNKEISFNDILERCEQTDSKDKLIKILEEAIKEKKSFNEEIIIVALDGKEKWVRLSGQADPGKENRFFGSMIDITESKKYELELQKEKAKYKHIYENNPQPILIWDLDTFEILDVNQATLDQYGYSYEEMTGMTIKEMRPPEDIHLIIDIPKDVKNIEAANGKVFRHLKKNGEQILVEVNGRPIAFEGKRANIVLLKNVTQQIEDEAELLYVQTNLKQASELANFGSWDYNVLENTLFWSDMVHKIHEVPEGFIPDVESGINFYKEGYHREKIAKLLEELGQKPDKFDVELKIITYKGRERWVRVLGQSDFVQGKLIRIHGAFFDIHDRKLTQEKLREKEALLSSLTNNIPGLVLRYQLFPNNTDKIHFISQGVEKIFEVDVEGVLNNPGIMWGKIHPEDLEIFTKSVFESGQNLSFWNQEWRIIQSNGNILWLEGLGKPEKEEDGSIIWNTLILDITERKANEEQLRLLESVVTNTRDSILITEAYPIDKPGPTIIYANNAFTEMTGYSLEEVKGKTPRILQGPKTDKAILSQLKEKLNRWESAEVEIINYRKNGETYWANFTVVPISNENGYFTHWISVQRDITAQKLAEQALVEAKESAITANKAKSSFLANMSHEIRTPLNGIIGFTDLLQETPLNKEQKEYMQAVNNSAKSLFGLINDILDFSKIEAGKMVLNIEEIDLPLLLNEIVSTFKLEAIKKGISLDLIIDTNIPRNLRADQIRIRQILVNLLSNAIKFTNEGSVKLQAALIEESANSVRLAFSIIDTGIGIEEAKQEKIFHEFEQEDASTTRKFGGTGLGLAITQRLLKLMDSEIKLKSKPKHGSNFHFEIEIEKSEFQTIIETLPMESEKSVGMGNYRILIAEDIEINALLVERLMRKLLPNCQIEIAKNGFEAIEKYKNFSPDMIFMDLQMPEMSGFEASHCMRNELQAKIPIIALSAGTTTQERKKCKEAGMNEFLSKPLMKEDLIKCLKKHLKEMEPIAPNPENIKQHIIKKLGSDEKLAHEVYLMAKDSLSIMLKDAYAYVDKKNWMLLKKTIHKMKGTTLTLGLIQAGEICKEIEQIQEQKNNKSIRALLDRLAELIDDFEKFDW